MHKVAELKQILRLQGQEQWTGELLGLYDFPQKPPKIAETGETFAENAQIKANAVAHWLALQNLPEDTFVLADDSGLCVEALNGAPGVRSARYAGENATDHQNNQRLVAELQARGITSSPAQYTCVLALQQLKDRSQVSKILFFEGQWNAEIRAECRGSQGFGYDLHMWICAQGMWKTVAELSFQEKCKHSHRAEAGKKLLQALVHL